MSSPEVQTSSPDVQMLSPVSLHEALRELVIPGALGEPNITNALHALGDSPAGHERFWAAAAHLFGVSSMWQEEVPCSVQRAEALLTPAIESEEVLRGCPDCAALWGYGRHQGAFAAPRSGSMVSLAAQAHGIREPMAAYALASQNGGSLGRLALGQARARSIMAMQHEAVADEEAAELRWSGRPHEENGTAAQDVLHRCLESLELVMSVASQAVAHEHTAIPQPVDLNYFTSTRRDDRQNYALASQLAADGHAEGLAAQAEMLFYGKEAVVPDATSVRPGRGLPITSVVIALLVALVFAAKIVRRLALLCSRRKPSAAETTAETASNQTQTTERADGSSRCQVLATFLVRICLLLAAFFAWVWANGGTATAPMGALLKNEDAALGMFEEAAGAGHWGAAYALAMLKLDGENKSEATSWLQQVVEHGDDSARAMAGHFMHRFGLGTARDPLEAGRLLQEAAVAGESNADLLLAEAHVHHGGDAAEIELPEGQNLSVALRHYRRAAAAGRLTCRYNIGVILVKHGEQMSQDMSPQICNEAYAEFVAVATDLDPTVRLLFALALRAWDLGNVQSALGMFMLLSEAGSDKAHRNAAQLWEELSRQAHEDQLPKQPPEEEPLQAEQLHPEHQTEVETMPNTATSPPDASDGTAAPSCNAGESAGGETFELVHEGRFCCASGECSTPSWLLNEGGLEPVVCAQRCVANPHCSFMTFYTLTGYCQLSVSCGTTHPAGDNSAQTYAVRRPAPQCREVPAGTEKVPETTPRPTDESQRPAPAPSAATPASLDIWSTNESPRPAPASSAATPASLDIWCWPMAKLGLARRSRRCAAAFHARATDFRGDRRAPAGSAIAEGVSSAEAAALAAAKHLQWLGLPSSAHAWGCHAAARFDSIHGRLLCAALEAEAWVEHPRNLTVATNLLEGIAADEQGTVSAWLSAKAALMTTLLRFAWVVLQSGCHLGLKGVSCPALGSVADSWAAPAWAVEPLEQVFTACALFVVFFCSALMVFALRLAVSVGRSFR